MNSGELSSEEKAEIVRKQCRYRELILSGKLDLPHNRAAQLLGPDCLYRLYSIERRPKNVSAGRKSKPERCQLRANPRSG